MRSIYARIGTLLTLVFAGAVPWCAEVTAKSSEVGAHTSLFQSNGGQWASEARFLCDVPGLALWVGDTTLIFDRRLGAGDSSPDGSGHRHITRMRFSGASARAHARPADESMFSRRYFLGESAAHSSAHRALRLESLYAGIDLALEIQDGSPRYDFHVSPGANPADIAIEYEGIDSLSVQAPTELTLHSEVGNIVHRNLLAYQINADGARETVECRFRLREQNIVGFEVGAYDKTRELIIDPLVYSTFLGGYGDDQPQDIVLFDGKLYLTGFTTSRSFPDVSGVVSNTTDNKEVFVTRLAPDGASVEASAVFGGLKDEEARSLAVLPDGRVVLVGWTESGDFPVSSGSAIQDDFSVLGPRAAFLLLLEKDFQFVIHGTYYGGSGSDEIEAVQNTGNVLHCVGTTGSTDLYCLSSGALKSTLTGLTDAFYMRFVVSSGSSLDSGTIEKPTGTLLGGSSSDEGNAIQVYGSSIYVAGETLSSDIQTINNPIQSDWNGGEDMFFAILKNDISAYEYVTYYGGPQHERVESIGILDDGSVVLGGNNEGGGFRTTPNAFSTVGARESNPVVVKFKPGLGTRDYASYLGLKSPGIDFATFGDLTIDSDANIILVGSTTSKAFEVTDNAEYPELAGSADAWTIILAPGDDIDVLYSSYFGGASADIPTAVVSSGNARFHFAGFTKSAGPEFPTTENAFSRSKLNPGNSSENDGFAVHVQLGPNLITPDGGEIFCAETEVPIEWEGLFRDGSIDLALRDENNGRIELIATDIETNSSPFSWNIPDVSAPEHNFRLVLLGQNGRVLDSSATVFNIYSPPKFNEFLPEDTTVCSGTSPRLFARAGGYPEPQFIRWEQSTTGFDGSWEPAGVEPPRQVSVERHDGRFYRVVYANECDTVASPHTKLNVEEFDAIISGGGSFCVGSRVTLKIVEPADVVDRGILVRWEVDRGDGSGFRVIEGEQGASLAIDIVDASRDGWRYRVFLATPEGCEDYSMIERIDIFPRLTITEQPQSREVCFRSSVEFSVDYPNNQPTVIEWQWRRPVETDWSVAVGSGDAKRFRINNVGPQLDGRRIRVAVYHCNDTTYSSEAILRVIHPGLLRFVESDTLDLGRIESCNLSTLQIIQIRNDGPSDLTVQDLFSSDPGVSLVGASPNPIPPGQVADVSIAYEPRAAGLLDFRADLIFEECDVRRAITILGDIRGERPRLEPAAIDFGAVPVCTSTATRSLELVAPPENALELQGIELSPPFSTDFDLTTPVFVAAGERLPIPVTLSPVTESALLSVARITYQAVNCVDANVLEATLTADVGSADLTVVPPALDFEIFDCELPYSAEFELNNPSAFDVPLQFSGEVLPTNAPTSLAAGASVRIGFSIAEIDALTPLRMIISNMLCGLDDTLTFTPRLTKVGPIELPLLLDYGIVRSGITSAAGVGITNTGETPITLTAVDGLALGIEPTNSTDLPRELAVGETFELSLNLLPDGSNGVGTLTLEFETPCGPQQQTIEVTSDQTESYSLGFSARSGFVDLGDTVDLCFTLITSDGFGELTDDFRLSFEFEYNSTIVAPVDLSLETRRDRARAAIRIDTILPPAQTEIICIPMISGWGNATNTYFEIVDVSVSLASSERILEPLTWTQTLAGVMLISGIGQRHLINPVPGVLSVNILNTPMDIGAPLQMDLRGLPSDGATLEVYDSFGRLVYSGRVDGGVTNPSVDFGIAAPGVYFCQVSVGAFAITRPFVVN